MRGFIGISAHAYRRKSAFNPGNHLFRRDAEILQTEGNVFLDDSGDDLVVRILENHTGPLADLPDELFIPGVVSADDDISLRGNKQRIQQFGHGGFAGSVVSEDSNKLTRLNQGGYAGKSRRSLLFI